ncbi:MAG: hypothetical protein NXI20_19580 [bacterium]|nr:hypothetical protein [bacterium]
MKYLMTAVMCIATLSAFSQNKKKDEIAAIKSMCGCYEVKFNFSETFSPDKNYEYHDKYASGALELVLPIEESKNKISLQHLLVIGDSMIIKHWRQDWIYENTDFYTYDKNNNWTYSSKDKSEVAGQWTQKVYQVDDGPRYEGSATWVLSDGRQYWESTTDAPLPRREFSKRSDYNVMKRRNRQEITSYGWVHEQDNEKIQRESNDEILAFEKGWNTYTKVADSKCKIAETWWDNNEGYWTDVKKVWTQIFDKKEDLAINMKVDDKVLFQRLFALGKEVEGSNYDSASTLPKIEEIFKIHLSGDFQLAAK